MTNDEGLFEELQRLVSQPFRDPPPESVAALHAEVARRFASTAGRPWWRQKAAVGAAVFGLLAGAPAAAFAIGGAPLPDPVRTAMHAVGLPIDSVRVADTKAAETDLANALKDRHEPEIRKAAAHLQTCLAELDGPDRARLAPHADALLDAAAADDDGGQQTRDEPTDGQTSDGDSSHQSGATVESRGTLPGGGSSLSTSSSDDGGTQSGGGTEGSGDGGQTATVPASPSPATGTTVPAVSGGGDGGLSGTSTTTVAVPGQTDGGEATTTTVQAGGSDGSDGGSGSNDGGSNSSSTTTTTDTSH